MEDIISTNDIFQAVPKNPRFRKLYNTPNIVLQIINVNYFSLQN